MDWVQFWSGIIGAVMDTCWRQVAWRGCVAGSITTGFFTIYVAKLNLKDSRKRIDEERKIIVHNNRPEFEIFEQSKIEKYCEDKNVDLELLLARIEGFDGNFMEYSNDFYCVDKMLELTVKIENVGKTDIGELWIATNYVKTFSVFEYAIYKKYIEGYYYRATTHGYVNDPEIESGGVDFEFYIPYDALNVEADNISLCFAYNDITADGNRRSAVDHFYTANGYSTTSGLELNNDSYISINELI